MNSRNRFERDFSIERYGLKRVGGTNQDSEGDLSLISAPDLFSPKHMVLGKWLFSINLSSFVKMGIAAPISQMHGKAEEVFVLMHITVSGILEVLN